MHLKKLIIVSYQKKQNVNISLPLTPTAYTSATFERNAVLAVQSTFTLIYYVIYLRFTCSVNILVIFSIAYQAIGFPRNDLFTILSTFFPFEYGFSSVCVS